MESLVFDLMQQENFESIYFFQEKTSGLKAVIAIHDTTLGPAAGGIRMWNYGSEMEAIQDAMRLAQAMTYKWAAAGANLGGGKCVIIGDPKHEKTEALLRRLGRFIQRLNGQFLAGPDVGTTIQDMDVIARLRREGRIRGFEPSHRYGCGTGHACLPASAVRKL